MLSQKNTYKQQRLEEYKIQKVTKLFHQFGIQVDEDDDGILTWELSKEAKLGDLKTFLREIIDDMDKKVEEAKTQVDRGKLYEIVESIYLSGYYGHDKAVLRQYLSDIINSLKEGSK